MATMLERFEVRLPGHALSTIVVVSDPETGVRGYGEAPAVPGRSPALALRAAEEAARLDAEARLRGVRVADLLGGAVRESVTCSRLVTDARRAGVAESVQAAVRDGFDTFKLKSVDAGGPLDSERLAVARWAAGGTGRLRIDFNGRLEHPDQRLRGLSAFGLEYAEQPLPPAAPTEAWVELARSSGVTLAADESVSLELVEAGVLPAVKVGTAGGPRQALGLAAAAGRATFGSSMETSIGIAAALHAACAYRGELLACGLATFEGVADLATGLAVADGRLALPPGPGLGIEVDVERLERYRA